MSNEFKSIRTLRDEGLVHRKLLQRVRILTAISGVLLFVGAYNAIKDSLSGLLCGAIALLALTLGIVLFSRINPVVWDEEQESIAVGRMDATGFGILLLYILFDLGIKSYLHAHYPDAVSVAGYIFTALGASLLGRALGTRIAVYQLAEKSRALY